MDNGRAARLNSNGIAPHVLDANPLSADALRSILHGDFPKAAFHSALPLPLPASASLILIVNAETLRAPLAGVLRAVRSSHPKSRVIVLHGRGANEPLAELLSLGAVGVVPCELARDELCDAIRAVARDRVWAPVSAFAGLDRRSPDGKLNWRLTDHEETVLRLLEHGYCNKEIASIAGISVPTVRFHLRNIYTKIAIHDRYRAVEWARRHSITGSDADDTQRPAESVRDAGHGSSAANLAPSRVQK